MTTRRSSTGSIAVEYEDFEPEFQWKEDESSYILLVHLPEFEKEQMKIAYIHSSAIIRVTGEKPISKNKWRRFNKAFVVPQNCNVHKIQAKFQTPTLTITLPKITPSKSPISNQDFKNNDQELKNNVGTKKQEIPDQQPRTAQLDEKEKPFTADKKKEDKLTATDEKKTKDKEEAERGEKKLMEDNENNNNNNNDNNNRKREESVPEAQTISSSEELISKELKNEDKTETDPLKDDLGGEVKRVSGEVGLKPIESNQSLKEEEGTVLKEKAKQVKKRVMELGREISEDKQSLVNVGVAILVIAALGAYISYTYGSSSNSKV